MNKDKIIASAMKEAIEFVSEHTNFNSDHGQVVAAFAIAEYICKKNGVTMYLPLSDFSQNAEAMADELCEPMALRDYRADFPEEK